MEYRLEEEKLKILRSNRERMETDATFAERVAREELGFVKPGETVIKYVDDQRVSRATP
jgi:cell division protein FtsB